MHNRYMRAYKRPSHATICLLLLVAAIFIAGPVTATLLQKQSAKPMIMAPESWQQAPQYSNDCKYIHVVASNQALNILEKLATYLPDSRLCDDLKYLNKRRNVILDASDYHVVTFLPNAPMTFWTGQNDLAIATDEELTRVSIAKNGSIRKSVRSWRQRTHYYPTSHQQDKNLLTFSTTGAASAWDLLKEEELTEFFNDTMKMDENYYINRDCSVVLSRNYLNSTDEEHTFTLYKNEPERTLIDERKILLRWSQPYIVCNEYTAFTTKGGIEIIRHDAPSKKIFVPTKEKEMREFIWSRDATKLCIWKGHYTVIDTKTGRALYHPDLKQDLVPSLYSHVDCAFSPDSKKFMIYDAHTIKILDASSGAVLKKLPNPAKNTDIGWMPDSKRLLNRESPYQIIDPTSSERL